MVARILASPRSQKEMSDVTCEIYLLTSYSWSRLLEGDLLVNENSCRRLLKL